MSEWALKRFWTKVDVEEADEGHRVTLDGRRVKTPAKADLVLPTRGMAEAVAEEWKAQEGQVDPLSMPFTRSANAAIDRVMPQQGDVADMLAAYGDADLLCYRAEAPVELVERQAMLWDPALGWAEAVLGAKLEPRTGVIHAAQPPQAVAALTGKVHGMGPFHLAAFHDLVGLTGSLVLGFAAAAGWRDPEEIWTLSRLDEDWQAEHWGQDEEAAEEAEKKRRDFHHAKRFFDLSGPWRPL